MQVLGARLQVIRPLQQLVSLFRQALYLRLKPPVRLPRTMPFRYVSAMSPVQAIKELSA